MSQQGEFFPRLTVRGVHSPLTSFYIKISGGFPFDNDDKKSFKISRCVEAASLTAPNKQIIIDHIQEPLIFLNDVNKQHTVSWYEFIHDLIDRTSFNSTNIIFLTSNIYAKQSYNDWCEANSISNRINVKNQEKSFWISKLLNNGFKFQQVEEDKNLSMFIGRPNFQKNLIVKWYLDKVADKFDSKIIATFIYGNFDPNGWGHELANKIDSLPGSIEDNTKTHPLLSYPWGGNTEIFSKAFSRGLVNFCVDFLEHENFYNYEAYVNFKENNRWWHEDMLSEKLFKCVILKRPFIRLGMPRSLTRLKEWGFKTFDGVLFDESYDDMENFYDRLNCIIPQVEKYLSMSFDELKEKVYSAEVQQIIEHNYNLAYEIYNNKEEGKIDV